MINATKNDLCPWHQRELFCAKLLLLYTQFLVCEMYALEITSPITVYLRAPTVSLYCHCPCLSVCLPACPPIPNKSLLLFRELFSIYWVQGQTVSHALIYAPRPTTLFLLNHPSDCLPAHHQLVVAEAGNSTIRLDKSVGAPNTEQEPDRQQTGNYSESILSQVDIIKCPASDIPCPPPLFL